MPPGPHSRKCTPCLLGGPGGMPLSLRLSEGLGLTRRRGAEALLAPGIGSSNERFELLKELASKRKPSSPRR